jgi:hypothetical protein
LYRQGSQMLMSGFEVMVIEDKEYNEISGRI